MIYLLIPFLLLLFIFFGALFEAPWIPTRKVDYERIGQLANLKSGEVFYDLGSGFGGLLFHLADKNPKAKFIGIEIALIPFFASKLRSLFHPNAKIIFGDLKRQEISDADAVFLFLMPETLKKVQEQIISSLKPTAKIITACWGFDFSQDDIVADEPKMKNQSKYFVYTAKELMAEKI